MDWRQMGDACAAASLPRQGQGGRVAAGPNAWGLGLAEGSAAAASGANLSFATRESVQRADPSLAVLWASSALADIPLARNTSEYTSSNAAQRAASRTIGAQKSRISALRQTDWDALNLRRYRPFRSPGAIITSDALVTNAANQPN